MNQYIVFQQFIDQNNVLRGGQASNPVSFKEAGKRFREAREFRQGSECISSLSVTVKVGVARLPLNYPGFNDFNASFDDLCAFRPQVSVICLPKPTGAA